MNDFKKKTNKKFDLRPAPLLKDAKFDVDRACELYADACEMIRKLFWNCRLVHADLSEFNLIFFNNQLYVIDVSQSVEHDHPHALEFLRKDCANINGKKTFFFLF